MGFIDKLRNITSIPDENYYDGDAMADDYGYDSYEDPQQAQDDIYAAQETHAQRRVRYDASERDGVSATRVVDINSNSRSHMAFKKVDKFEEVVGVADEMNQKKIVLLNLETCPNDVTRRVLDFLSGVAYANEATTQRIAGRAYVIVPKNVPLSGELLEQIENGAKQ